MYFKQHFTETKDYLFYKIFFSRKSENLDSVGLSVLLDPETRPESRFSYNLNQ